MNAVQTVLQISGRGAVFVKIQKADEIGDFTSYISDIDGIFLHRAQNVIFVAMKKDNIFERCHSDVTLQSIEIAFSSRLMSRGVQSGTSPVASKLLQTLIILATSPISIALMIFVEIILHTFTLILRSNIDVEDWGPLLFRAL